LRIDQAEDLRMAGRIREAVRKYQEVERSWPAGGPAYSPDLVRGLLAQNEAAARLDLGEFDEVDRLTARAAEQYELVEEKMSAAANADSRAAPMLPEWLLPALRLQVGMVAAQSAARRGGAASAGEAFQTLVTEAVAFQRQYPTNSNVAYQAAEVLRAYAENRFEEGRGLMGEEAARVRGMGSSMSEAAGRLLASLSKSHRSIPYYRRSLVLQKVELARAYVDSGELERGAALCLEASNELASIDSGPSARPETRTTRARLRLAEAGVARLKGSEADALRLIDEAIGVLDGVLAKESSLWLEGSLLRAAKADRLRLSGGE
jgi:tetratricopeptide (TPR) repeat protein